MANDANCAILQLKSNQKLAAQCVTTERIPVAAVGYELGHECGRLYIYGSDRRVYFPQCPTDMSRAWNKLLKILK